MFPNGKRISWVILGETRSEISQMWQYGKIDVIAMLETKSLDDSRKSPTIHQSSSFPFITTYHATCLYLADIVAARR